MNSIFQSLDSTNKRIVVVAFSLTIVLLGASVFLATISQSFAQSGNITVSKPLIGLGCDESSVYYFDSNYNLKTETQKLSEVGVGKVRVLFLRLVDHYAATGTKKWEALEGFGITSSPTVANGVVYALSRNRKLYALDAATGTKKWEYNTYNSVTSPTVRDGIVYFATMDDDKLNAVDVTTGSKKWDYMMFLNVYSSPTVVGGVVYTCSFPGLVLYALDAITGVRNWESYNSTNSTVSSPCVLMKSGKVYHSGISGAQE